MDDPRQPKELRDFLRWARFGSSVLFGFMTATLYTLKSTASGLGFEWSWGVIPAFFVGVVLATLYWRLTRRLILSSEKSGSANDPRDRLAARKFKIFSLMLGLGAVAAFLYPLRFVPRDKLGEIVQGLLLAFAVLGLVGTVVWRIKKFLDKDTARQEEQEREEEE